VEDGLRLIGKRVVDFLLVLIELFSLGWEFPVLKLYLLYLSTRAKLPLRPNRGQVSSSSSFCDLFRLF